MPFTSDDLAAIERAIASGERWLPVPDPAYAQFYEVSSLGRVRSSSVRRRNSRPGHVMSPRLAKTGYLLITFSAGDIVKHFYVHRLVASAFIRPGQDGEEVNHVDGSKTNNRDANLEWVSSSGNKAHAIRSGLTVFEGRRRVKLSQGAAAEIRRDYPRLNMAALAIRHGVAESSVRRVLHGRAWSRPLAVGGGA